MSNCRCATPNITELEAKLTLLSVTHAGSDRDSDSDGDSDGDCDSDCNTDTGTGAVTLSQRLTLVSYSQAISLLPFGIMACNITTAAAAHAGHFKVADPICGRPLLSTVTILRAVCVLSKM